MTRALVWDGKALVLTDSLEVTDPGPGQVKVRIRRSGICHSDLNMMDGGQGALPMVLGHEGAGTVLEVGPGVSGWQAGDEVMIGTQTPCGECRECRRGESANCDITWGFVPEWPFRWQGQKVASFAHIGSFAGEVVVDASQLYRTDGLPPEEAALVGCAVSTGYGAVVRLARAGTGDRIVIFGVGGIGVNAIQVARQRGADILAVDINPDKEAVARHFGADRFLAVNRDDAAGTIVEKIHAVFPHPDTAIECSGAPVATQAALDVGKRGARVVLIGQTTPGASVILQLDRFMLGGEILSQLNGGARPDEDYPEIIRMARDGQLDIGGQVTKVWPLAAFEEAIAALREGRVTRAMLDHEA